MKSIDDGDTVLHVLTKIKNDGDPGQIREYLRSLPADLDKSEFKQAVHFAYAYEGQKSCIEMVRARLQNKLLVYEEKEYLCRLLVELIEEAVGSQRGLEKLSAKTLDEDEQVIQQALKDSAYSGTEIKVSAPNFRSSLQGWKR